MSAITSDPSCFELSDDGINEPESDVSCTSAAISADHGSVPSLLTCACLNRCQVLLQTLLL